ncbi:hypothetical protein [Oceanicella sp. SM1341]|uniref:hypothetical protein n=1 Tax=Oceanicella sp. SM1341 TaxID=1548889 RepID=UPI000E484E28|nr:hypothetical protein [Oceanicella sp. SM1341]
MYRIAAGARAALAPSRVLAALLLPGLLALAGAAPAAERRELAYWEHGSWRVAMIEQVGVDIRQCEVFTGGDGNGSLRITVGEGGSDAALTWLPVWFRGMEQPITLDDEMVLLLDGQESPLSGAMEVFEGPDEYGEPSVDASLGSADVPEAVRALRAGNVLVAGARREGALRVIDTWLLDGFTAAWLKASEWCGFDPRAAFRAP